MNGNQTLAGTWLVATFATALALSFAVPQPVGAQDAVTTNSQQYTVEFENDQVRILRVVYGPQQKSSMHEHPDCVGVYLTDGHIRITLPDGRTGEPYVKAGQAMWHPAGKHEIENLGDTPFELLLTEMKTTAAPVNK